VVTVMDKGNAAATEINRTRPTLAVPKQMWDANRPKHAQTFNQQTYVESEMYRKLFV
jgi:hypothetical protein